VGILLVTQPFFIGGIDNVQHAKGSAFGAAATFLICFVASVCLMMRDTQRQLEFDTGGGGGSIRSRGSGSLHSQSSSNPSDLFSRVGAGGVGAVLPFSTGTLFHDYDPVHMDDRLDDADRGVFS
jgi:hypothetical protein